MHLTCMYVGMCVVVKSPDRHFRSGLTTGAHDRRIVGCRSENTDKVLVKNVIDT